MLRLFVFLSIALSMSANASLVIIANSGNSVDAAPYLSQVHVPTQRAIDASFKENQSTIAKGKSHINDLLYPAKSTMSYGFVTKHKIPAAHFSAMPIFIIGDDAKSLHWLKVNAHYLKSIHAIGIITNVTSPERVKAIEKVTGMHLLPESVSGLQKLIGTNYYPVLIQHGWVVQ